MSYNQLDGTIPAELARLQALDTLELSRNQFSGSIPPQLGNLQRLRKLDLHNDQLSGSVPPELGQMSALGLLSLQQNQLTGSIPPELGNLQVLDTLDLSHNQLSGTIPTELGRLQALDTLELSSNQLSGIVPKEIGNIPSLRVLRVEGNQLSGDVPELVRNHPQAPPLPRVPPAPLIYSLLGSLPLLLLLALVVITYVWVVRDVASMDVARKLLGAMLILSIVDSALYRLLAGGWIFAFFGPVILCIPIVHAGVHGIVLGKLSRATIFVVTMFAVSDLLLVFSYLFQPDVAVSSRSSRLPASPCSSPTQATCRGRTLWRTQVTPWCSPSS